MKDTERLRPSSQIASNVGWCGYWNALFPPRPVTPWIDFKRQSTGVNVARRLWNQREYFRRTYESVHGRDPGDWPAQHPAVVLDEVLWIAHAACLRCQWFAAGGSYMKTVEGRKRARLAALRHEVSDGQYLGHRQ